MVMEMSKNMKNHVKHSEKNKQTQAQPPKKQKEVEKTVDDFRIPLLIIKADIEESESILEGIKTLEENPYRKNIAMFHAAQAVEKLMKNVLLEYISLSTYKEKFKDTHYLSKIMCETAFHIPDFYVKYKEVVKHADNFQKFNSIRYGAEGCSVEYCKELLRIAKKYYNEAVKDAKEKGLTDEKEIEDYGKNGMYELEGEK